MLLDRGPEPEALVPSPVLTGMRTGRLVRIEEITRCLPEVQDALISVLSERRMMIPELEGADGSVFAAPGFNIIATANLRDRGVSEMSAALKRRLNFETVPPIADAKQEIELVRSRARRGPERIGDRGRRRRPVARHARDGRSATCAKGGPRKAGTSSARPPS